MLIEYGEVDIWGVFTVFKDTRQIASGPDLCVCVCVCVCVHYAASVLAEFKNFRLS